MPDSNREENLLELSRKGDRAAFSELVELHLGSIYRTAFVLTGDRTDAEDVTQEAFLRAWSSLAQFRGSSRFGTWLTSILRHVASNWSRSARRRERRVEAFARSRDDGNRKLDERPSGMERDEAERLLWDAVSDLPETLRLPLVLYYARGESSAKVAEQLGLSAVVVRKRLQLAREKLRGTLPSDLGTVVLAIAPPVGLSARIRTEIAELPVPPSPDAASSRQGPSWTASPRRMIMAGSTTVATVLLIWIVSTFAPEDPPAVEAEAPDGGSTAAVGKRNAQSGAVKPGPTLPEEAFSTPGAQPVLESSPDPLAGSRRTVPAGSGGSPAQDEGLAELRGRFLYPDGSRVAGVPVRIHGWVGNTERVAEFGLPENWEDPTGRTAEDGTLSIRFDPPRAYQFVMDFHAPGYAIASWRWGELPAGEVTDVGEITLVRGGTIEGRLLTPEGEPVPGKHSITADTSYTVDSPNADQTTVSAWTEETTGRFRLEDVPPGGVKLTARIGFVYAGGPKLRLEAGDLAEADIVYEAVDTSQRVTVRTWTDRFHTFRPAAGTIKLVSSDGDVWAYDDEGFAMEYVFEPVPEGRYTVEIDDPRFETFSQADVKPGDAVHALLRGSSAVKLIVEDPEGERIADYHFKLRYRKSRFSPNTFLVRQPSSPAPPLGVYAGIVPGEVALVVSADGFPPSQVDVTLEPGRTHDVSVTLGAGTDVTGVVTSSPGGQPVAGAELRMAPTPLVEAAREWSEGRAAREELAEVALRTQADEDGRFRFEAVGPGHWTLHARANAYLWVDTNLEVPPNEEEVSVTAVLPKSGTLTGALIVPEGKSLDSLAGLSLEAVPEEGGPWAEDASPFLDPSSTFFSLDLSSFGIEAKVNPDGTFRMEALPSGKSVVQLTFPSVEIPASFGSAVTLGQTAPLESVVISSGEETSRSFELSDHWPGLLDITVSLDGSPGVGLVVMAFWRVPEEEGVERSSGEVGGQVGRGGKLRLGPVFPGEWQVLVQPVDGEWHAYSDANLTVGPGEVVQHRFDLNPIEATLTFVDDETGAPLANRSIMIGTQGTKVGRRTDAEGKLTLLGVPGTVYISSGDGFMAEDYALEWTAVGPVTDVVRLRAE